jgi:hypothetical protein
MFDFDGCSTYDELRKQMKVHAIKLHPDKNPSDTELFRKMWDEYQIAKIRFLQKPDISKPEPVTPKRQPKDYSKSKAYTQSEIWALLERDKRRDAHNIKRMNEESLASEEAEYNNRSRRYIPEYADIHTEYMAQRKQFSYLGLLAQMAITREARKQRAERQTQVC